MQRSGTDDVSSEDDVKQPQKEECSGDNGDELIQEGETTGEYGLIHMSLFIVWEM